MGDVPEEKEDVEGAEGAVVVDEGENNDDVDDKAGADEEEVVEVEVVVVEEEVEEEEEETEVAVLLLLVVVFVAFSFSFSFSFSLLRAVVHDINTGTLFKKSATRIAFGSHVRIFCPLGVSMVRTYLRISSTDNSVHF